MSVSPIPDGYASVTPYLIISGAKAAIEFYKTVFGATERLCLPRPDGRSLLSSSWPAGCSSAHRISGLRRRFSVRSRVFTASPAG